MVKKSVKNPTFKQRSSFLTAFLLLFFALIVVKLFDIQIIQGHQLLAEANAEHTIYQQLLPSRGQIELADSSSGLDTIPVATNLKSYLVYAVPQDIINPNLTASS